MLEYYGLEMNEEVKAMYNGCIVSVMKRSTIHGQCAEQGDTGELVALLGQHEQQYIIRKEAGGT